MIVKFMFFSADSENIVHSVDEQNRKTFIYVIYNSIKVVQGSAEAVIGVCPKLGRTN
jgi:catabolite regulation protein CreA